MLKKLTLVVLAGCLALGTLPASGEAANLGRLLGAQRPVITRSAADLNGAELSAVRSAAVEKRQASVPEKASPTLGSLRNGTPRAPLLKALILLFLVLLATGHFG